jgi:hypothetical protein
MKAMTILIAVILTLQSNIMSAANDHTASLAPVTPLEATFEEVVTPFDVEALAPVTPTEATFEEVQTAEVSLAGIAPQVPVQADFEDLPETMNFNPEMLAPATPVSADFE